MNKPATPMRPDHPSAYWKSLRYFNFYRLIVVCILLGTYFFMQEHSSWASYNTSLYLTTAVAYAGFGLLAAVTVQLRWPRYNRQLTLQVIGDIAFIVVLMYANGGVRSGLGLLLVVVIAAASLVSQGRLALFYASLATIAVLLEQSYQFLVVDSRYEDYTHAVMLGLSFFATALLAHSLAKRARQSEELASQRGIDLKNLVLVNQLIIRDMQDGVLVVDKDFQLRQCNTRAEQLLGISVQAGKESLLEEYSAEVARQLRAWIKNARNQGGAMILNVGNRELRLRFLPVGAERTQGAVIFVEDWSRVQSQAQQIKLASLGRLTANIAHEIRNPLSAISHASQLLQEEEHADPTTLRLLQIVQDNVQRLDGIVQDVLQLNQRDRAQIEGLEATAFMRKCAERFCQIENVPPEGVALELSVGETLIAFDRRHLDRVLWNLCCNGWRHGRKQAGSLRLRLEKTSDNAVIAIDVLDDGAGVKEDSRPHLFEPFFTTEAGGTGLGLYIARELCEANDASLEYIDSPQGKWFRICAKKYDG